MLVFLIIISKFLDKFIVSMAWIWSRIWFKIFKRLKNKISVIPQNQLTTQVNQRPLPYVSILNLFVDGGKQNSWRK